MTELFVCYQKNCTDACGNVHFRMIKLCFTALLILTCHSAFAQNFIGLKGKIVNSDNDEPVNAAGIYIKNTGLGTISNDAGEFSFFIPPEYGTDTIYISALGFKNYRFSIARHRNTENLKIKLKASPYVLDQVVVKSKNRKGTAQKLIKRAIDSMKFNYPQEPFQIGGYYRDYLQKQRRYFNLLEAAIEVEDRGFAADDIKTSRLKLLQLRYNPQYLFDSTNIMLYDNRKTKFIPSAYIHPMDGNEFLILRSHDVLRNYNRFTLSFIDIFSKSFVHNHTFRIDSITYLNDIQVYSISFEYNNRYGYDSTDNFSARGYLVLRKDNLAISKIVYNTYIFNKDYDGRLYSLNVEYREVNGKYYPQFLSFGNYFKIRNRVDTSTFVMRQTVLRKNQRILELNFNRAVDSVTGSDTSNFSVRYGKTRIALEKAVISKNIVRLYLHIDNKTLSDLTDAGDLTLTVNELADVSGNRMAGKYNGYYQHREFYVNKIIPSVNEEFPYSQIIPKTTPLYWNPVKPDPEFWKTYNIAYEKKLE